MRALSSVSLILLLLAACGGSATPPRMAAPADPASGLPAQPVEYGSIDLLAGLEQQTLENGMKVFVKEDRRLPVACVTTVYRVGSVHEPEGTSGLAHFLEHMLFKGTDTYAKFDIDRVTVRCGGANNAYTENDYTLYWFSVPADGLDDVLRIEASRMRGSTLDAKEMDSERKTVLDELHGMLDSPGGQLQYEIDQIVFKKHSYRRPGWGFESDLKTVKHEVMKKFYEAHYGPNNCAMVIVGAVEPAKAFARVREVFAPVAKVRPAEPPTPPEPPQEEENRVQLQSDKSLDRMGLAWRTNRVGSDEDFVLDVIQNLLTHGKDARLYKRLVVKDRLAYSADATNNARRYDGVFYIFTEVCEKKEPADVEKAVLEELEALKTKPVAARELQKAKNLITANFIFGKETPQELAESIGAFEGLGQPDYLRQYLARIEAVTPAKIQAVAASVFRRENRTVAVAKAKHERRAAPAQQAAAEFGECHEHRLPNGLTILLKPRRGLPIVSVTAYVDAGPLTEPAEKAGVAELTGRLLDQGYETPDGKKRTAEQIAEAIEFTGAHLATSSEGVSIKALTRDVPMALDAIRDMLIRPTFPRDKVDLHRDQQLAEIAAVADDPSALAPQRWYQEVFAGHPLQRPPLGLAETVEKLAPADVEAHHGAFYRPDNVIVAVAGDIDAQAMLSELRKRFADWKADVTVVPALPPLARAEKGRTVVEFQKTKQINLCFGHLSVPHTHPDYFALRVFEQVFCFSPGGFTDRLSRIVREEEHLAYELGGRVVGLGRHPAPFLIRIGTGVKDGLKAHEVTLRILKELLAEGPKEEELEIAKGYLTRSIPFRWASAEEAAQYMVLCRRLRLGIDWPLRYRAGIAAVKKEDVVRAARAHLSPEALTTVIVGPVDKDGKVVEDEK